MFGFSLGDILFIVLILVLVHGVMGWLAKRKKSRDDSGSQS